MTSPSAASHRFVTLSEARERIRELAHLNAFISLTDETGDGPVVAVKDLIDVRGTVTTGGGTLLPNVPATEDAPVIRAMRQASCVVVGKANLHEWAFGTTSANPHYGVVRNPHDPSRIPGGSSGGSAVAVAAGMCDWAIGTDTGGSIRIPAALCGVVGVKPTQGLIDSEGVFPLARSIETSGPMAPDVVSAARALEIMTGRTGFVPERHLAPEEMKLAVPRDWVEGLDAETQAAWDRVGHGLPLVPFPSRMRMRRTCTAIMYSEAAAVHRHWMEAHPEQYGADVLERLLEARQFSGADYVEAMEDRERLKEEVVDAMSGFDALLLPATACVAPRLGQPDVAEPLTRFTRPFNATGQPVVALPVPASSLPVGVQIIGRPGEDARVLEIGWSLESAWTPDDVR